MKILNSLKSILWFVFVAGTLSFGQDLNPADSQFFDKEVNVQNLSVQITAPVISKPGAIPFSYALEGISECSKVTTNATTHVIECGISPNKTKIDNNWVLRGLSAAGAWSVGYTTASQGQTCAADGKPMVTYTGYFLISPDFTTRYFSSADYTVVETGGTSCNHSFTDYTVEGGVKATVTGPTFVSNIILPNGYTTASARLTDTFGNFIAKTGNGYADTLLPGTNAVTIVALNGATGEADSYTDTTGAAQQIAQVLSPATVKTAFACSGWQDLTQSVSVLTELDYPDGTSMNFAYESIAGGITGRLQQLTLRTGGTIQYSYGAVNCGSMIPASLTRTTIDGTTTYTFAVFGSTTYGTTTTVLDPGKNKTVYAFMGTNAAGGPMQGIPLTLTQVQTWQNTGTVASPVYTLLSTTIYCYNGNATACPTTQAAYPITQKDTYVKPGSKTTYSRVKQTFDIYGNVLTSARYDFVALGAGTPVETTNIGYGSWNGSACVAVGSGIVDKPCSIVVRDAASNALSQTLYTYGSTGFMTAEQHFGGPQWITTSYTPNANGTVHTSTNPAGAVTTYSYTACNGLLLTGTSTVFSTGDVLTTGATWDCNMGKLMSSTDENSNTSNLTYDLLGRSHTQTDPSGNYTLTEEHPTNVTETISDPFISTTVRVDGLGRPIRTQTTDGASYDTVSSAYAFSGTQFQVSTSQPCIVGLNADCTKNHFGVVDPLGRSISSSTTSNETVTTSYNQNGVSTTLGPTTPLQTVQMEYDGLGRVKSVCALQATGGTACGQLDGNSGVLTTYSYSSGAWSRTVTATRGGQAHTTVYDALGRVTSATTPEAGTTTYTYDTSTVFCGSLSSPGYLVETVDGTGSHLCFLRDQVGRILTSFNPDAGGVWHNCRSFVYGEFINDSQHPTQPSGSGVNSLGRIAEAQVDYNCNGTWTPYEWFSYDDDGRVTDVWESTAHSGGVYHTTASYYLNGALSTLSGVPGKSTYTVVLDTEGRPDSSTLGATGLITNVTYNAAGQTTLFNYGSSGGNDAFTFDANTGRMKTYTYTVGTATDKGTLTWNPSGTLKTLAIVDGLNAGGTQTCNFTYDDIGRLLTDNCGAIWNQSYAYDQYDNFSKSGSSNWNPGYNSTITCPTGTICNHITGANYDDNGRVTYDLNNSYSWDVYGKMVSANAGASVGSCGSGGITCVTYDAFGRPAEKQVAGTWTEFLYSPLGLTGVMNGQTTTYFRLPLPGGALLNGNAGNPNQIQHYDWLGSARLVTNLAGGVTLDAAYTPYGEKYAQFGSSLLQNFTGDFQDLYTGLFDTPNREFDQAAGSRWLSPDPAHASWNAYAYTTNPNSRTDPSGLEDKETPPDTEARGVSMTTGGDYVMPDPTECDIMYADGGCYGSSTSLEDFSIDAADTAEPTFSGGFWGDSGVQGSDAAWGMVSGTFNSPQAALAQTVCGGGVACQIGTGLVLGAAIGGAQGLVSGAGAIESLALNTKPGANSIANFRSIFNTNATFLRGTASDVSPVGAYHTSPLQVAEGGRTGSALFSQYKGTADGMWRISNHWGNQGSTSWFLNDMTGGTYDATSGLWMFDTPVAAFVRYVDMAPRVY
jgi:RHS repeat-associated protein